ncbi:hypothetical protein COOONC_27178 [Cooperia oncophora]
MLDVGRMTDITSKSFGDVVVPLIVFRLLSGGAAQPTNRKKSKEPVKDDKLKKRRIRTEAKRSKQGPRTAITTSTTWK